MTPEPKVRGELAADALSLTLSMAGEATGGAGILDAILTAYNEPLTEIEEAMAFGGVDPDLRDFLVTAYLTAVSEHLWLDQQLVFMLVEATGRLGDHQELVAEAIERIRQGPR